MNQLIYCVDDDAPIRELLESNLQREGFRVRAFAEAEGLLSALGDQLPDLFLLDWMLPGMDGLDLCRTLRQTEKARNIPIIMLTAKDQEIDMILGLEMGADDYISKPFSMRELTTRIKAIFRRVERLENVSQNAILRLGEIEMDPGARRVTVDGKPITLTLKEFELLKMLLNSKGMVLTRELMLDTVWGYDYDGGTRTVDVHIMQLRKRLGVADRYIETVRGVGYRMSGEA
ncbi:MAG: response regulator [Christensenellales bacterium]|jgi:two-component system alkaline phosphatase synthesis response regulator PhoP